MTTLEYLLRAKETERKKLHLLNPSEHGFSYWAKEKLERMWVIQNHIEKTRLSIEDCSQCNGGCKDCLRIKT